MSTNNNYTDERSSGQNESAQGLETATVALIALMCGFVLFGAAMLIAFYFSRHPLLKQPPKRPTSDPKINLPTKMYGPDDEDPTVKVEDDIQAYENALHGMAPAAIPNVPQCNRWKKALQQYGQTMK